MSVCKSCDNVHGETRKLPPWKWRCMAVPIPALCRPGLEFVDPEYRDSPPYQLCEAIRRELPECPAYEPRRPYHPTTGEVL
jgi:hypothetical protein